MTTHKVNMWARTELALLLLSLAGFSANGVAADTYSRQPGVDAWHYTFQLTLSDDTDEILGETTVDIRFVQDNVSQFALDLASAANGKGMTVSDITSGGKPVHYTHSSDRLVITLDAPPKAAERRQFVIHYRGIPAGGLRIIRNKYGERCFFSENWPDRARQWLPTIDHPYDKATSEFIIIAPDHYQAVANGALVEETDLGNGTRLTHWKESVPIASWLNAIGVAQFATRYFGAFGGIPLETWVYHQDRNAGIAEFETPVWQAIEFYSQRVAPYPYEKLGNVEAAGIQGGTEHASEIFYGEDVLGKSWWFRIGVPHEIAHQWFGDSVTEKDWDDVWLSEGFATYFSLMYVEHYEGRDAFMEEMKRSREEVFATESNNPGLAVIHDDLSDMSKVLNWLVYIKGAWTLHMLRSQIGDDRFWAGIRDYYQRYSGSNASTDDFRKVMEENSGMDLAWFFHQWLNRAASPVLDGTWTYNAAAKKITIELVQTQKGDPFRLSVEIGISGAGDAPQRFEKLDMREKQQSFELTADSAPVAVSLDPHTSLLAKALFKMK
jgi:aminopeptidase N